MQVIEHTETTLILKLDENQFLYIGLQIGGSLVFVGLLMLGADFRTNPDYDLTSAQNLNSFMKILAGLSILIGLVFGFTGINNQDDSYIFDKEAATFRITGRGWRGSYNKEYPISHIKEVIVNRAKFTGHESVTSDPPDVFYISLRLEMVPEIPKDVFLQYRNTDFQLISEFADTIRKFIEIDA